LADYPDLLEYEEKIQRKAALQRMLRFASEENWEAFQQELRARPDLTDHAQGIKKEAKMERMLRFASEGNQEAFNRELQDLELTAKERKLLSEEAFKKLHWSSCQQAQRSTGNSDPESAFRLALHYKELNPQDGIESALARVIPALTEVTLECFCRASGSDALPARNLELGYAMKGALVLSALAKAYDSHRDGIFKAQRDRRNES